eukprot:g10443.t1
MANFAKAFLFLHLSVCGRTAIFDPAACELAGWQDERQPFRIINACFILHWILFLLPLKGVTVDVGHEQLWYRARLRATAVPMHLTLAYLKPKLRGTPFERSHLEPVLNGLNAAMVCIIVWSLDRQWRTSGVRDALDALESDAASDAGSERACRFFPNA